MHIRFSMFLAGVVLSSLVALLTGCGGGDGPAIKALPQTIQFGPPPTLALNGTATVTATASSGLPVSYSSLAPEVCAVNGATGRVNNLKAGICLIAADQPGNNDYAPAPRAWWWPSILPRPFNGRRRRRWRFSARLWCRPRPAPACR